jgi:hypothetical protein
MDLPSEKDPIQSAETERQRKTHSLNSFSHDRFSNPPPSPNSSRKSRPISMFVHPQEKLSNQNSEIINNNGFNTMPTPENTTSPSMPFSLSSATVSEVDVASVNSSKTMEMSSNTEDQESLSSDFAERTNNPQGIVKMLCELDV